MRQTMRAALAAGAVVVLGVAVTPAVAAGYHRPPPVGPVSVLTEPREAVGWNAQLCDDDGPMAEMMRRAGPGMAAMHRAHHENGAGSLAGMGAMHRAHHADDDAEGEDMMDGGGIADMMGDLDHMSTAGGRAG